jgi:glycosyltransferase involved in cell wall biosynthesis
MRVLHLIPSFLGGGAERQLSYVAPALARQGVETHVAFHRSGPNLVALRDSGVLVHRLNASSNYDPQLPLGVLRLVRHYRPDIIQSWLTQMDLIAAAVRMATPVCWILSERSSAKGYPPTLKNRLRARAALTADAIIANSHAGAEHWNTLGYSGPTAVVRNAIKVSRYELQTGPITTSLPEPYVLFAGRLAPEKNLEALIDAFAIVARRNPTTLILAGEGPLDIDVHRRINERGLTDRVILLGYVNDLPRLMRSSAAFVSLSHFEGHPNTVLEACALGVPLVVSDIQAHREFLTEDTARLVSTTDPSAAALAILSVLEQRPEAAARAAAAKAVITGLTVEAAALGHIDVYESLLRAPRRRAFSPRPIVGRSPHA